MRDLSNAERTELEKLVDACGLCDVLGALFEICQEKADHIAVSYGDSPLANLWHEAGDRIGRVSTFAAGKKL
jgi:hypothetical protein